MFRFEDHMPSYWVDQSRDFLLLTRIDDILYMGLRADIYTIQNLNDSTKCKNTFLNLLAKKVGFFTDKDIDDKVLRNIIGSFRLAIKHKGTKKGIFYAVIAVLKALNNHGVPRIDIDLENFEINIYTPVLVKNIDALRDFLNYIKPAGYLINIYSYNEIVPILSTKLSNGSKVILEKLLNKHISNIRLLQNDGSLYDRYDIPLTSDARNISNYIGDDKNNYLLNTYASSVSLGIIAALEDLRVKSATGDQFDVTFIDTFDTQRREILSDNDTNTGVEIKGT